MRYLLAFAATIAAVSTSAAHAASTPSLLNVRHENSSVVVEAGLPGRMPRYEIEISKDPQLVNGRFTAALIKHAAPAFGTDPIITWRSPVMAPGLYHVHVGLDVTAEWLDFQTRLCAITGCLVTWDGKPIFSWSEIVAVTIPSLAKPKAKPKKKRKR